MFKVHGLWLQLDGVFWPNFLQNYVYNLLQSVMILLWLHFDGVCWPNSYCADFTLKCINCFVMLRCNLRLLGEQADSWHFDFQSKKCSYVCVAIHTAIALSAKAFPLSLLVKLSFTSLRTIFLVSEHSNRAWAALFYINIYATEQCKGFTHSN